MEQTKQQQQQTHKQTGKEMRLLKPEQDQRHHRTNRVDADARKRERKKKRTDDTVEEINV